MPATAVKTAIGVGLLAWSCMFPPAFASNAALEVQPWPAATACTGCIPLQFGMLDLRLPAEQVSTVFISAHEPFAVHLLPPDGDARNSLALLANTASTYIGKYQKRGLLPDAPVSAQQYFDRLGNPAAPGGPLTMLRRIESIDQARQYIKSSRGDLHAYWIKADVPNTQYLHIIIEGSDTMYLFAGTITPELYMALLANMRIRAEP